MACPTCARPSPTPGCCTRSIPDHGRPRLLEYAALALLTLIWGTTWAAIRVGLEGIPPLSGVALRFGIAGAALLALAPLFRVRLGRSARERRVWAANSLLTFTISYGIVYWCEQTLPSGLAAILFAVFPLVLALLAHVALPGEGLTVRSGAGVVLGFAGIAVIFSDGLRDLGVPGILPAAGLMLLSPVTSALGNVAVKRWGGGIHPLSVAAVPMALTGLTMGAVAALVERGRGIDLAGASLLALLYLALVGSALAFTLYFWVLGRLPATQVSLVAYTSPVVAVGVGALFLHEPVTLRTLAGSALVVLGVALAVRSRA